MNVSFFSAAGEPRLGIQDDRLQIFHHYQERSVFFRFTLKKAVLGLVYHIKSVRLSHEMCVCCGQCRSSTALHNMGTTFSTLLHMPAYFFFYSAEHGVLAATNIA